MNLKGRTALITGAAGFIGSWLAERLVTDTGVHVRGLVQPSQPADWLENLGVEIIECDITDADSMREIVAGCDLVFHLAAWLDEPPSAEVAWTTNVIGTETMLAAAADVMRFVYVSSIMVYGAVATGTVNERHPFGAWHPTLEPYGATKVAAERRVFRAFKKKGLPVTVIRPSHVYGPRAGSWVARALRRMHDKRPILIGGGLGFVNPVYVENLVDGIILAAQREQGIGEAFNISDGIVMTWHDFYGRYGQLIDCHPRSIPIAVAYVLASIREIRGRFTGQVPSLTRTLVRQVIGQPEYSIEKARRLLGHEPRVDFEEAMHRTEVWHRNGRDLLQE